MNTYRGIHYEVKNDYFIHFYNPKAAYYHDSNKYGRDLLVRSLPEGCKLTPQDFAKTVIDALYDREKAYFAEETRLFWAARSNRHIKNALNS